MSPQQIKLIEDLRDAANACDVVAELLYAIRELQGSPPFSDKTNEIISMGSIAADFVAYDRLEDGAEDDGRSMSRAEKKV